MPSPISPSRNAGAAIATNALCHGEPGRRTPLGDADEGDKPPRPGERRSARETCAGGSVAGVSLYDETGPRKYLTESERKAFLAAAERADRQVRILCMTLAFAGYRLSDVLALTADRVDLAAA